MDDDTVGRLRIAYSSLEDIDLFPGGMSEKPVIGKIAFYLYGLLFLILL